MQWPNHKPDLPQQAYQSDLQGRIGNDRSSPRKRLSFAAACLTIFGIAFGRFVTTPQGAAPPNPPAARVGSLVAINQNAIPGLEAKVRDNPADVRALQQLAVAYTRRAATGDPSFYELADRTLVRAEGLAAADPQTKIARASLNLSLHQFAQARDLASEALKQNPDLNDAVAVLVDASIELGRYDEAEPYLQQLVDRRATLPSYARVSYLRELHGDLEGAASAMQQSINAGQAGSLDVADVNTLLGDIQFNLGNLDASRASYERALQGNFDPPLATLGIAKIDGATNHIDRSIATLTQLVDQYPLPSAITLLGDLQQQQGDRAGARDSFQLVDAIATLQRNAGQVVDLEMAQFALDHQRVAQGITLAEAAHAARPDNVFTADVLAWARFRQGRFAEASKLSARALRLGTHDVNIRFHAAAIAFADGRQAQATKLLRSSYARNQYISFAVRNERDTLLDRLGIAQ